MIDPAAYRRAETLAGQFADSWRPQQAHFPVTFARVGFPVRVESLSDLRQFTDTMQEGRFVAYMEELGGLSKPDLDLLVDALADWARWFCKTFHTSLCRVPLDTMLAHLALYTKIRSWPRSASILEIGPGSGYLGFYLKRHKSLTSYTQIETTECFYLLQGLVNDWCFEDVRERAALDNPRQDPEDGTDLVMYPASGARCRHVPWWQIDRINEATDAFDIVTANACITEMSHAALKQYADIIGRCLNPDGAVIVQCGGGGELKPEVIMTEFDRVGLRLVVQTPMGTVDGGKSFAVPNTLLVRKDSAAELPPAMYGVAFEPPRRDYTPAEIVGRVRDRLDILELTEPVGVQ